MRKGDRKIRWWLHRNKITGLHHLMAGESEKEQYEIFVFTSEPEDRILLRLFKPPKMRLKKGEKVEISFNVEPIAWEVR